MSSKKKNNFFKTLAFRLTLLYTGFFVVSTIVAFACIYMLTSRALIKQVDEDLFDDVEEFSVIYVEEDMAALDEEFSQEAESDGEESVFFRLFDYEGKTLFTTSLDAWGDLEDGAYLARRYKIEGRPLFSTIAIPGTDHKARTILAPLTDTLLVQFGESLEESERLSGSFCRDFYPDHALRHHHSSNMRLADGTQGSRWRGRSYPNRPTHFQGGVHPESADQAERVRD